jgi:hypothetical protein
MKEKNKKKNKTKQKGFSDLKKQNKTNVGPLFFQPISRHGD